MKKYRIKWSNIILLIILIISLITLTISVVNIIQWKLDHDKVQKQLTDINKIIKIEEKIDDKDTITIEPDETIDESDPYWDFLGMNLINVNFKELKNINPDTKGWIQVNGTTINYPFVQTNNNEYYLTHDFNKGYNSAGWVFLDYRNTLKNNDRNTIIYAHGRLDQIMFGSLKNILSTDWVNNTDNYIVKLSTEYENTLWQVFSIYRIPTTNDYIQTSFSSNQQFKTFVDKLINRSNFNFNTYVSEKDRILTLSTCYNDEEKVVLHAKLIKYETR